MPVLAETCGRSESGAIVILAAIGLLAILLMVGVATINFGMIDRGEKELQLAVDAAAASGASRLCSDVSCYKAAREMSVAIISSHSAISSIGGNPILDISGLTLEEDEYVWSDTANNLQVTIERGVWHNGTFESFEGSWQEDHPGIPAFIAANSVRIQILRPEANFLSSSMGSGQFSINAAATAVKGATEPTNVAPFALPVCALINNAGKYYGEQSGTEFCKADRYFTRSDRFETISGSSAGANRGPAFAYEPCNREVQKSPFTYKWPRWPDGVIVDFSLARQGDWGFSYFASLDWLNEYLDRFFHTSIPGSTTDGSSCLLLHGDGIMPFGGSSPLNSSNNTYYGYFGGDSFDFLGAAGFGGRPMLPQPDPHSTSQQLEDLYGTVGLPGDYSGSDIESEIQNSLRSSTNPVWPASLGDQFTVLPGGLSSSATDTLLWNAIVNGSGGAVGITDAAHPNLGSTPIGTFEREFVFFSSFVAAIGVNSSEPEPCPPGYECEMHPYLNPADPALLRNGVDWFFRNNISPASRFDGLCNSKWTTLKNFRMSAGVGIYHDEFRVAADGVPTPGLSDQTPVLKVTIPVIADASAGATGCFGIDPSATEDPLIDPASPIKIVGFVEGYVFDVDIGNPQPEASFIYPGGYTHHMKGWGFMKDVPGVTSCNTVHSRLACKRWFIPDSNLDPQPITTLIE